MAAAVASDTPSTVKLLSELERSWAMFSASWSVVDLFGGLQIYQQTTPAVRSTPVCVYVCVNGEKG